tara:strand:- start:161 stop:1129 length:969 start_codon:yes stop_codon:yes gene_type:complete
MNILITGGAGYIGSVVANYFIDLKHQVTIIDNLSRGYKFLIPKKAIFLKSDISDKKKISNLLSKRKFNLVIHLAGFTDMKESLKKPKKYIHNNYQKSKIFFDMCEKHKLNKIIFSSTAAVYKNSSNGIVHENSNLKSSNPYGKSKILSENYLKNKKNIRYIILRYFNVAGSDFKLRSGTVHQKSLIKNLIKVLNGEKNFFSLYGKNYNTKDGTAIRDFIHVMDLARIHYLAGIYLMKNKKNLILNCGYNRGYTVNEILRISEKIFKTQIKIKLFSRRKGDLPKVIASNVKIKKILGWKPKFNDINNILKSSLKWEKKLKKLR